jgi:hypothetical protein
MANDWQELSTKTRDELFTLLGKCDYLPYSACILNELHHRDAQEQGERMLKLTRAITWLTVLVAILTFASVALVVYTIAH